MRTTTIKMLKKAIYEQLSNAAVMGELDLLSEKELKDSIVKGIKEALCEDHPRDDEKQPR